MIYIKLFFNEISKIMTIPLFKQKRSISMKEKNNSENDF